MKALGSTAHLDTVVVGGCGHVGLPLALVLAKAGYTVGIYDTDDDTIASVRSGDMPFVERGADELLREMLATGRLHFSSQPAILSQTDSVVVVIGTPIDEFLNPSFRVFDRVIEELASRLKDGALVVLRSTVYPGTTDFVAKGLRELGLTTDVVFCPERVAEGHALQEIAELPQIIGATSDQAFERAAQLFAPLGMEVLRTTPMEAELAKLLTNTWRYMKFAIANQFFQMAHSVGVDYDNVLQAVRHNYPRAADVPGPGFAAGPCLLKDTMQLAAFSPDHFPMGHAAMLINEGLPAYVIDTLDARMSLEGTTVGILGMAFKGDSDDARTSLSYKLKKLAQFKGAHVLCSDPYVRDLDLLPVEKVMKEADVIIIGAPHSQYRAIDFSKKSLVDIWGIAGSGITL
jgi:UDP-N-acetyl-D-mannosaminuronic acid dehydrogenase